MCTGDCDGTNLPTGPAGADGLNAFTTLTAQFTQPSVGSNVTIAVSASGQYTGIWAVVGQVIYISAGGYYEVVSVNGTNSLTVKNLGYTGNASPTATVATGGKVSPAGISGTSGSSGSNGSNGTDGADGVSVIDTDVTDITTSQTSFTTANKTVTIPADTWETVDDTVEFVGMFVANTDKSIGGLQFILDGTTVDLGCFGGTSPEAYFGGNGYPGAKIKLRLVMSAAGTVTPVAEFTSMIQTSSSYAAPFSSGYGDAISTWTARGAAISGLTITSSMNLVLKMTASTGSIKMFFSQVTVLKK